MARPIPPPLNKAVKIGFLLRLPLEPVFVSYAQLLVEILRFFLLSFFYERSSPITDFVCLSAAIYFHCVVTFIE